MENVRRIYVEKKNGFDVEAKEILALSDVLVDGRFIAEEKDISLQFRGSSNQRLIDLNATRAAGTVCLLPERKR